MKYVRILLALMLALSLGLGALTGCSSSADDADTITYFENGTIYTADDNDSTVEALAIQGDTIVFAGTATEGKSYKEQASKVVDLDGKMLMPGFIDSHCHTMDPSFFEADLTGTQDMETAKEKIAKAIKSEPDRETYYGFGYPSWSLTGEELDKGPTRQELDEVCSDKPVLVFAYDGHTAWLNTKAFEYLGITPETKSPPGGNIPLDANGELWGTLQDGAMAFVSKFPMDQEKVDAGMSGLMQYMNSYGITSIMNTSGNGFMPVQWDSYKKLQDNNQLTMRIQGCAYVGSWNTTEALADLPRIARDYNSDLVNLVGVKFFLDGVVDNESAYLLEPYADNPDKKGASAWEDEALAKATYEVNKQGLLAHYHSMGDAATRQALDAIEYSQSTLAAEKGVENGKDLDLRNSLTHLQIVSEEDIPRFSEMGVYAVTQPYWHNKFPDFWEPVEEHNLGTERAENEYPLASFVNAGASVTCASDYPVTVPPNPLIAIETGVTRNWVPGYSDLTEEDYPAVTDMDDPTYLLGADERATVTQMLRGFTIEGARASFLDERTGSLEVGKKADMIILDQDLLTVDPLQIHNTKVLTTYMDGNVVYTEPTAIQALLNGIAEWFYGLTQ